MKPLEDRVLEHHVPTIGPAERPHVLTLDCWCAPNFIVGDDDGPVRVNHRQVLGWDFNTCRAEGARAAERGQELGDNPYAGPGPMSKMLAWDEGFNAVKGGGFAYRLYRFMNTGIGTIATLLFILAVVAVAVMIVDGIWP
jgi:hypothetical protein